MARNVSVLLRADASAVIGAGHVMRCQALAAVLAERGVVCTFVVSPETVATLPTLAQSGHAVHVLPEGADLTADLVVVDHYGLGLDYETGLPSRVAVIDDLPTRPHRCQLLLDQTHGRAAGEYRSLVPEDCRVLAGSAFALLRPQFRAARPAALARRDGRLRRILVSLGGTDADDVTGIVLRGIALSGLEVEVDVVMGAAAPHLAAVRAAADAMPGARVHVAVEDMAGLMAAADLAIGAGGTTTWERCCLGLPTLILVIAENQRDVAAKVVAAGAARLGRADPDALAADLRRLDTDPPALARMAVAAAGLCDGHGAPRVADAIISLLSGDPRP